MKSRFLSITFVLGLSCLTLAAQTTNQPAAPDANPAPAISRRTPDPNHQAKELAKKLNLTADQQNQIEPMLADRLQQVQAIRADNSLSAKDRHAKMQGVHQDFDAKIKAVLTDDQKQKYDDLQQQARQRMQERKQQ